MLDDEDVFDLLVEVAIAKGVHFDNEEEFMSLIEEVKAGASAQKGKPDLSALVDEAMDKLATKPGAQDHHIKAVVNLDDGPTPTPETSDLPAKLREKIATKLGLDGKDEVGLTKVDAVIARLLESGIQRPNSYLSIREAVEKAQVSERTVRRYISDGVLLTEKVKGARGWEHRVYAPALFILLDERSGVFERARTSPIEDMGREIASLCRVIVEQQSIADRRTDKLLEEIQRQSRTIDELRAEQRDARAQMHNLQEQMIRALMPRKKPSIWERLFDSTSN